VDLGAAVLNALVDRTGIDPAVIEDVITGCVSQGGEQSQQVGRQIVLSSKLPESVPAVTIDRQCGSSQQAIQFAAQAIMSGMQDIVVANGIESMTRVPMGTPASLYAEKGLGTNRSPGIEARYPGIHWSQFGGAEMVAKKHGFTKDQIDQFGYASHMKAKAAVEAGRFANEIIALEYVNAQGETAIHDTDEGIRFDATLEGIQGVKLLMEGGMITAATSSQICDGSSAALVVSERALKEHNLTPRARIHTMTVTGGDPVIMLEEPLFATDKALQRSGLKIGDIDAYEVNEAFAPVPMAWLKHTGADPEKLNMNGGAIALGHPLGASGTKLMATLINVLEQTGGRYGLQTMCEGGGLANVTIIERV
jgi:acetyl-CoA C-acetyltransferase